jgi:hypothetical protein
MNPPIYSSLGTNFSRESSMDGVPLLTSDRFPSGAVWVHISTVHESINRPLLGRMVGRTFREIWHFVGPSSSERNSCTVHRIPLRIFNCMSTLEEPAEKKVQFISRIIVHSIIYKRSSFTQWLANTDGSPTNRSVRTQPYQIGIDFQSA